MSLLDFEGGARARSAFQLQRDVEDALEGGNAMWEVEHNPDGTHGTIGTLTIDDGTTINGTLEVNGPYLVDVASGTDQGVYGTTLTGTTNNLALPDGRAIRSAILRLDASTNRTLTGIVPYSSTKYQQLVVVNASNATITLSHNSGSSSALNRFSMPNDSDYALASGRLIMLWYDPSSGIWRAEDIRNTSMIKSIQAFSITISNAATSNTATITSVDTAKSHIEYYGQRVSEAALNTQLANLDLTNATTVTATRAGTTNTTIITGAVVEYL